jgi:lysophospholipase-2
LIDVSLPGSDVGDISEDAPNDVEGLDASAAHIANLLSTEPPNSMFSIIPRETY